MPLCSRAVDIVLRESCFVTRSPRCDRLHRQTVKPLPTPTCLVSSSTYLFGWTDHGAVTTSSGANTTKRWSQQGPKDQTNERRGFCHLGVRFVRFFLRHSPSFFFLRVAGGGMALFQYRVRITFKSSAQKKATCEEKTMSNSSPSANSFRASLSSLN